MANDETPVFNVMKDPEEKAIWGDVGYKTDPARMETVLHTTAEVLRRVGILCQPYIPASAEKLLDLLAVPADRRAFAQVGDADALTSGTKLPEPRPVFPRSISAPRMPV